MKRKVGCLRFVLTWLLTATLLNSLLPVQAALVVREPPLPRPIFENSEDQLHFFDSGDSPSTEQAILPGDAASAALADWSSLVFQSYRDGNWNIYRAKGDGSSQTRLTNHSSSDITPRLNRGCTHFVFASNRAGNYEIYTMKVDGSDLQRLTSNVADDVNPAWSPDGTQIVFQSYRDSQSEIYVMNASGSGQVRLTADSDYDGEPAWSPDGTQIAFVSRRTGGYRVWVMDADGSRQMQMSNQPYSGSPAWSPDGSQIAYHSDGDNDDWMEIWLMNADGSSQHEVYDPPEAMTDAWVRSWSPDGRLVAFTRISFVYYQGNWYWTYAYLDKYDVNNGNVARLSNNGMDWRPDWQTCDTQAPTSHVNALPADSPGPIFVSWTGFDAQAGIRGYDVQVKDGAGGVWTDWITETLSTSAAYPGLGGHTYYFRARACDKAFNLEPWPLAYDASTTVEALPPTTTVDPLPSYSKDSILISWGGNDPGNSGIQTYDVQYRDGDAGAWTNWQSSVTVTSAEFTGTPGHTYYFRSRGTDRAQNVEAWAGGDGDAHTAFYTWKLTGRVRDNTGTPIVGAVITTTPGAFAVIPSNHEGDVAAYVAPSAGAYSATWGKVGYGALPTTEFSAAQDGHLDVFLPPADNVVLNWGFETGSLGPGDWEAGGDIVPVVTSTARHTGDYAALLGIQQSVPARIVNVSDSPRGMDDSPQMVVDSNNTVHVVWRDVDTMGLITIRYAYREHNGSWSAPYTIGAGHSQQIAADQYGNIHVLWATGGSPSSICYARRGSDGVWYIAGSVYGNRGSLLDIQMIVDGEGNLHAVWSEQNPDVYYAQRSSDGTWSDIINIANTSQSSRYPQLAMDGTGAIHVVWYNYHLPVKPGNGDIYYTRRESDGSWSSVQNLANTPYPSYSPRLVVEETGIVHVVWYDNISGDLVNYYVRKGSDDTWSSPVNIYPEFGGKGHQIALDSDQALHLVWVSGGYIYYARRESDGIWSNPENISLDIGGNGPQVVVGGDDAIRVVWSNGDIYYSQSHAGDDWITPVNISRTPGSSTMPRFAVDSEGYNHVVWDDETTGEVDVYYAGPSFAEQTRDSIITQTITVPITISHPILSYLYQSQSSYFLTQDTIGFSVQVEDSVTTTTLFSTTTGTTDWTHCWLDLSPWSGQAITLTFTVHQSAGQPYAWVYLDEVSLGSSYPDVWVSKDSLPVDTVPGGQIVYTITYGNQGGAPANSVWITDTLPSEVIVTDTSFPFTHTSDTSLVWDVGNLPAKSGPFTIVVTATVVSTATMWSSFTNTVNISTESSELEAENNVDYALAFVLGPDLWVSQDDVIALPGEQVVYTITYGNQGAANASGVWITATVPSGLQFVSSDPAPTFTTAQTLTWYAGDLAGHSGPFTIVVTATVASTVTFGSALTTTVSIASPWLEMEMANNVDQAIVSIINRVYLPIVKRD